MDRKDLIRLYLDAETTCEQEQELAASFAIMPPADEEEMAVYKMMHAVRPIDLPELSEAGDEFDRMVKPVKVRPFYTWGLSLAGVAAAIAAVVLFTRKPENPAIPATPQNDYTELIQHSPGSCSATVPTDGRRWRNSPPCATSSPCCSSSPSA